MLARIAGLCVVLVTSPASSQAPSLEATTGNLLVVLRETPEGTPRRMEVMEPMGKAKARLPDGREIEIDLANYNYLGDMHIRFVVDSPTSTRAAMTADLERLKLSPDAGWSLFQDPARR